jgi:hypothetical protein
VQISTGLFHCFACGASGSVFDFHARKHGLTLPADFSKVLAGIAEDFKIGNGSNQTVKPTAIKRYDYLDKCGDLVYQIERVEPGRNGEKKTFRIRRPKGTADWVYSRGDVKIIPYHLPEVLKAKVILIAEGEKDVDNLIALRFTATTNPFGAGK